MKDKSGGLMKKKYKLLMEEIKENMEDLQKKNPDNFLNQDYTIGDYENLRKGGVAGYIGVVWIEIENGGSDYYKVGVVDTVSNASCGVVYEDLGEHIACSLPQSIFVDWTEKKPDWLALKLEKNDLPKELTEHLLKDIDWNREPEADTDWSKLNKANEDIIERDLEFILKFIELENLRKRILK